MTSGRLVAANTVTPFSSSMPSISVSSVVKTRSLVSPSPSREPAITSISSRKTMHGAAVRAFRNVSRIVRSLSPTYLLKTYGVCQYAQALRETMLMHLRSFQ